MLSQGEMISIKIKQAARNLRQTRTEAEELLWGLLRDRRLMGCKFRRQHPIGRYIADFACLDRRLVIELDGDVHRSRHAQDRQRTAYLVSKGFEVIRFWNSAVTNKPDLVLAKIRTHLNRRRDRSDSSCQLSLAPRGRGRGEGRP